MRFVVVGGTTVDVLAGGLARLPTVRAGDEFTPQTLVELPAPPVLTIGGNGGNTGYALARLRRPTTVVTCLGDDVFGRQAAAWLTEAGAEIVRVPPHRTSCNLVATDRDGNRYSFFHPVAFDESALVTHAGAVTFGQGDHLHLTGFPHPSRAAMAAWLEAARAAGAATSLDIGPAISGLRIGDVEPLTGLVDVLFASRAELAALDPEAERGAEPDGLARRLAERVRTAVVVKGGADGAWAIGPAGEARITPERIDGTVTVGVGDAFDAGVVAALRAGAGPDRALAVGDAVAHEVLVRGRGVLAAPTPADLPLDLSSELSGTPGKDH